MRGNHRLFAGALPGLLLVLTGCATDGSGWCSWSCGSWFHGLGAAAEARVPAPPPAPFGTPVRDFITAQATKADAADFTIFLDEWYMGGPKLGPFGQRHLLALSAVMAQVPTPVLLQCSPDPELDQARRLYVVAQLQVQEIPDADQRVVLGFPDAEGLDGEYSERIYMTMLRGSGFLLGRNGFRSGLLGGYGSYGGLGGAGIIGGAGGVGGYGLPFGLISY